MSLPSGLVAVREIAVSQRPTRNSVCLHIHFGAVSVRHRLLRIAEADRQHRRSKPQVQEQAPQVDRQPELQLRAPSSLEDPR